MELHQLQGEVAPGEEIGVTKPHTGSDGDSGVETTETTENTEATEA